MPETTTEKPPRKARGPEKPETTLSRAIALASGLSPAQRKLALETDTDTLKAEEDRVRANRDAAIKKAREEAAAKLDEIALIRPVVEARDTLPHDFAERLDTVIRSLPAG